MRSILLSTQQTTNVIQYFITRYSEVTVLQKWTLLTTPSFWLLIIEVEDTLRQKRDQEINVNSITWSRLAREYCQPLSSKNTYFSPHGCWSPNPLRDSGKWSQKSQGPRLLQSRFGWASAENVLYFEPFRWTEGAVIYKKGALIQGIFLEQLILTRYLECSRVYLSARLKAVFFTFNIRHETKRPWIPRRRL